MNTTLIAKGVLTISAISLILLSTLLFIEIGSPALCLLLLLITIFALLWSSDHLTRN